MSGNPVTAYLLIALIALSPGARSMWSGRRLARLVDNPTLPELFAAHQRRNGVMAVVAILGIACAAVWTGANFAVPVILGVPIAVGGLVAAGYPLRRALYGETWSFASYFCFYPRLILGLFGFWCLLAAMPSLASLAGAWDWLAGGALAAVLVLWNIHYADVVRRCLRVQPIGEGELLARCRALADACGVPQPRFERIDLRGGVVANALCLPSLRAPSVLFTDTILDRFDQAELLAVCAHELAHFEYYNPDYLRRLNRVTYALIALGAAGGPILRITGIDLGPLPPMLWFAALVSALAMRARNKQRQETACDLRAVQLTGDADALVRGLTKLYTVARIPRRMQTERERAASHPSLARRIRDIRRAAGAAPVPLGGAHTFTSPDGGTVVTFDEAELRWMERDAVTHSVRYAALTELRVEPSRGLRLVAAGAGSAHWAMRIADPDVARLQAVLDAVDDKLADPPAPSRMPAGLQRAAVLMGAAMLLTLSHLAVACVALFAWIKPSLPLLAGAGFGSLAAAGLALRSGVGFAYLAWMSLPLATIGIMFLGLAWTHRHDDRDRELRPWVALLSLPAVATIAALAVNGLDVVRLHQRAVEMPSAPALLAAVAGTLICSRARRLRLAGFTVAAAALAVMAFGSTFVLERLGADPLLVYAPAVNRIAVDGRAASEFDVPAGTTRLDFSPSGQFVATKQDGTDPDDDEHHLSTFQIGPVGDVSSSITADDLRFVDDDRLLVIEGGPRNTSIKLVQRGSTHDVLWERTVDDLTAPSLSLDRATGRWRLTGWAADRSIVRAEGNIGAPDVQMRRWPSAFTRGRYVDALTTAGPDALIVEKQYERRLFDRLIPWRWTWARLLVRPYDPISRYATLNDREPRTLGVSKLDIDCLPDVLDDPGLTCSAYDGARTRIVKIDAATGQVEGLAVLDGHFVADQHVVPGWLTGWVESRPVAIRLSTHDALHVPGPTTLLSVAGDKLAALMFDRGGFAVRLYPLHPDSESAEALTARGGGSAIRAITKSRVTAGRAVALARPRHISPKT